LRWLHRWLGLFLATALFAVGTSGGLLLLRDPYYRMRFPALGRPQTGEERTQQAAVVEAIEARFSAAGVRVVRFPTEDLNVFHVWLADGSQALVDPRSGDVVTRWRFYESLPGFLFELHAHLLLGRPGAVVNGLMALGSAFLALSGTLLWWPRRASTFHPRRLLPRRLSAGELFCSHGISGMLMALPVLLFTLTGVAIVFYDPVSRVLSAVLDSSPPVEPDAVVAPAGRSRRPWSELLSAARGALPEGELLMYYPGGRGNPALTFRKRLPGEWHPNGRSYVLVDPYDARVIQAIDARAQGRGTRLAHALYPVHSAKAGGVAYAAVAALSAMGLAWLTASGPAAYLLRAATRAHAGRKPHPVPAEATWKVPAAARSGNPAPRNES
jgi:uncharacterized iron-regulated membrane protein